MPRRPVVLAVLAGGLSACLSTVPLAPADAARLGGSPPIPVAWIESPAPAVYCPADEGQKVWEYPSSRLETTPSGVPVVRVSAGAGWPAPGGAWQTIQDQWTRSIQVPPVDPAAATARAFVEGQGAAPGGPTWSREVVEVRSARPRDLERWSRSAAVLVFEVVRWDLVGCFFEYKPWFDVRATLVDTASGRVEWRDQCGEGPPDRWPKGAAPAELSANDGALYARIIEARATQCANTLGARLRGVGPPGG